MKYSLRAVIVVVWLAEALGSRNPLDADAVSYLNIADSCLAGNWHALVNGWWSPGFPFLLAGWLKVFRPGLFHRSLAVHLFAVFSLVVALVCFEHFLSVHSAFCRRLTVQQAGDTGQVISDDLLWLIGYSLFFWLSTFFIPPFLEQPDILVFIIYLLVAALCLQLHSEDQWWRFGALGVLLGLGYLAKAVMFPLAFVFLFALFLQKPRWRVFPKLFLAVAMFAVVSLPFCVLLSQSKGRFTFGDVGALAYRHVMGFDDETLPPTATPRPLAAPHIKEYSQVLYLGTYPLWADPSHGFKGAPFKFSLARQLNRTHVVLRSYFDIYIGQLGALVCGLLVLLSLDNVGLFVARFRRQVVLWLPALAGLAFYATMRFEPRFLPGYTVALFAACIGSIRVADSPGSAKLARSVVIAVSALLVVQAAVQAGHVAVKALGHTQRPDWQVAVALHELGVGTGDRVSYMGDGLTDHGWAYVASVRIVAEVPAEDVASFWAADRTQRKEVTDWLPSTGAEALVTHSVPSTALSMGWRQAADSDYYVLPLVKTQETGK